ncbi:uncharacterized protein AB675_3204 [Cyphellophora attinorum]|uniref:Uncharacterized protein n=1 Tax=Cyphellophora attinorum TaxID=1664694 RepID=A0A0N1NXU9_9EURO|nr:uncharacterized protein AB675_3204 [Phialophora attinorum]KPI37925.1 hypothetical protein AB675_3204 [Phialophora attinorum]
MGNLCSKSSNQPDNFSSPGRPLGGAATQSTPSSAPVPQKITTNSPGRTLGGDGATPSGQDNARSEAARAAEARAAAASKPGGKLSSQLSAQKKQTQNQLLNAGSEQERRARDADSAAQTQAYN